MTKEEYVEKFTKEVEHVTKLCGIGSYPVYVSVPNGCYICAKDSMLDGILGFLAEHEIMYLESTFPRRDDVHPVANIGFSEKEQKWYGWSHRAIFGFGVGSHVKKGDCAYCPCDMSDFVSDCVRFWADPDHKDVHVEDITDEGFDICWTYSDTIPNEGIRATRGFVHEEFPKVYGRGEWTAETLEDARQMAIDFANNIS